MTYYIQQENKASMMTFQQLFQFYLAE